MKKIWLWTGTFLCFLLAFVGAKIALAHAAGAAGADEGSDVSGLLRTIYDAFASGHRAYAGAIALVLVVALVKRYVAPRVTFLQSSLASVGLILVGAFGAALGTSLAGGAAVSFAIVKHALEAAVLAGGGFSLLKPVMEWISSKAPAWAQPILSIVMWIFEKPVADAKKAGDTAVAANPPTGVDGVTGAPKDVP